MKLQNSCPQSGKTLFFDFERDAYGRLTLEIESPVPGIAHVAIGECLKGAQQIDLAPGGFRRAAAADIPLKAGWHRYEFPIPCHVAPNPALPCVKLPPDKEVMPFRYVEISGVGKVHSIERHELYPAFDDDASQFHCSDERINRIWEFCKYSMKATAAFGVFVDGDRERLPYEGDTYINQLGWFCCSVDPAIPRSTINVLLKQPTWPIEWRLLMPIIARDYLLYSGDRSALAEWEEALRQSVFPENRRADGLLPTQFNVIFNDEQVRTIIDWPKSERDDCEFGETMLVPNCYLVEAHRALYELYGTSDDLEQSQKLRAILRDIAAKNGGFTDHPATFHACQHTLAFALALGVAEPKEVSALANQPVRCSVYAAQFLFDALWHGRWQDHALALLTSSCQRSWLHMIDEGATISMEAWDNSLKPNQDWNHAWGAAPANLIPRRLCGIRPVAPGFAKFTVDPQPSILTEFHLKYPTPHGEIVLDYEKSKFHLDFPSGMKALWQGKEYVKEFCGEMPC